MFKTNFQAINPYLLLGVPRSVTPERLQAAVVTAYSSAGGNHSLHEKIAAAHQRVLEDMQAAQRSRQTREMIDSAAAEIERLRRQLGVAGVDPAARPFDAPGRPGPGFAGGAGSWGPTVTGQVFEPGEPAPGFVQAPGNPYEVRQAPGFASGEFLAWERQFNKFRLEQHMYPTGKYNAFLAFFCFVGGIFGVLGGFWGWAVSAGLSMLMNTETGRETVATQGGWGMEQYAGVSFFFLFVLLFSIFLFFVPSIVKVVRRNKVAVRVEQLRSVGVANGWLLG